MIGWSYRIKLYYDTFGTILGCPPLPTIMMGQNRQYRHVGVDGIVQYSIYKWNILYRIVMADLDIPTNHAIM